MGRADECYDNAFMESCFGTLKRELEVTSYTSHRQAQTEIRQYVNYYNFDRKHSSLEYLIRVTNHPAKIRDNTFRKTVTTSHRLTTLFEVDRATETVRTQVAAGKTPGYETIIETGQRP